MELLIYEIKKSLSGMTSTCMTLIPNFLKIRQLLQTSLQTLTDIVIHRDIFLYEKMKLPPLRSWQSFRWSRNYPPFMEPNCSLLCSYEPNNSMQHDKTNMNWCWICFLGHLTLHLCFLYPATKTDWGRGECMICCNRKITRGMISCRQGGRKVCVPCVESCVL
jgi:hypothetical protein